MEAPERGTKFFPPNLPVDVYSTQRRRRSSMVTQRHNASSKRIYDKKLTETWSSGTNYERVKEERDGSWKT